jgi:pyruvate kinase
LLKKFHEAKRLRPYKTCALMMDVRGRTIRTSKITEPITFGIDDKVEFRTDGYDIESTKEEIQINYFELPPVMRDEDIVFIGEDGQVYG